MLKSGFELRALHTNTPQVLPPEACWCKVSWIWAQVAGIRVAAIGQSDSTVLRAVTEVSRGPSLYHGPYRVLSFLEMQDQSPNSAQESDK